MTKIRGSTIAIIALSVLLAVAVAATITLAAFSKTMSTNKTITFKSGVTMEITADSLGTNNVWKATKVNNAGVVSTDEVGATDTLNVGAAYAPIAVTNTSTESIVVAFQVVATGENQPKLFVSGTSPVTATDTVAEAEGQEAVTGNELNGTNYAKDATYTMTAKSSTWVVVVIGTGENATATLTNIINTYFDAVRINNNASKSVTLEFKVAAVFGTSATGAQADLAEAITAGDFTSIVTA